MAKGSKIVPLIILVLVVVVLGGIGFVVYSIVNDVANNTQKKMEQKNISLSRDGVKVGIKDVSVEQLGDSTQSVMMKAWNNAAWPAYKSRLGWGQSKSNSSSSAAGASGPGADKRKPYSQTAPTPKARKA